MAISRARSFVLTAVIVATAAVIAIAGGAFRASAAAAQTDAAPQRRRHPRRRHGLVGHRILRQRDSDAQLDALAARGRPLHPVLQHRPLLADARLAVDRTLSRIRPAWAISTTSSAQGRQGTTGRLRDDWSVTMAEVLQRRRLLHGDVRQVAPRSARTARRPAARLRCAC